MFDTTLNSAPTAFPQGGRRVAYAREEVAPNQRNRGHRSLLGIEPGHAEQHPRGPEAANRRDTGRDRLGRDQRAQGYLRDPDESRELLCAQLLTKPRGQRTRGNQRLSVLNLVVRELERPARSQNLKAPALPLKLSALRREPRRRPANHPERALPARAILR